MIVFLNKFFVDKFFILYFYISNSATYDFYVTIFLNLIAVFYFVFMLYILNFIAFLRNNFFDDLRVTSFISHLLGLSMRQNPDRFKQVMGLLAYYGYIILTVLEVSIKSSFLVIIGYFVVKAPFISLDPSPLSSWKFADLFSKSRFYSFRPWALSSSRSYRGFSAGNFHSEGAWFADDNDYVEPIYPQLLPYSEDLKHEDIFLRPGGIGLRLRTRAKALAKFSIAGRNNGNWTRHLLGSRRDRGALNKISAPRHRLERIKVNFSRSKSLELKSPIHLPFSYYRSEDDCYPISVKKGFFSRLYVPGFGSKARRNLIHEQGSVPQYTNPLNARQKYFVTAFAGMDYHHEMDPHLRANPGKGELDEDGRPIPPADKDVYKDYMKRDFGEVASVLQGRWLNYVGYVDSLHVKDPANYLGAKRFSRAYSKLKGLVEERSFAANRYNLPNKESRALNNEEQTLMSYFRYLTNDPSDIENTSMRGRYALLLNRNTPFRLVLVNKEDSPLYVYTFDNKFSSVHNLRGRHVFRRSLFDFINVWILGGLRSFSNFFGFNVERGGTTIRPDSAIATRSHEELFGFMINDREKFYRRVFKYGIVDDDNRPLQFRGREGFDLNYATAGSKFRYFFGNGSPRARERVPENSFIDRDVDDRETEFSLFESAADDRKAVNEGVYLHSKLRARDVSMDDRDFFSLGNVGFLNQYTRMFYQFVLDHFTYWLRIVAGMTGRNHYVPHFPRPASDVSDKLTGLNPYALFFKTFYFFRKCFRVVLFGFLSDKEASGSSRTDRVLGDRLEFLPLGETSDFTLIALKKTLFSYFARFLGLSLILVLNGVYAGFGAALDFTLNHITGFIFMVLLVIVSLFRVRYSYEFDINRIFFRSKTPYFVVLLSNIFTKAIRFVVVPFEVVVKSLSVLVRVFSTSSMQPPRKVKESAEVYYERLVKEQEIVTSVLNFFKVDRIRRALRRLGFLKFRKGKGLEGQNRGVFEAIFPKLLRKVRPAVYRGGSSLRSWINTTIRERFSFLRRAEKRVVTHRRLRNPSLLQNIKIEPTVVKKKEVGYISFEPTDEFLSFKKSVVVVVNSLWAQILKAKEFVKQKGVSKEGSSLRRHKNNKGLGGPKKIVLSAARASRDTVSYVKWRLTEWINKQ